MKDKFKVELFLDFENNLAESPIYDPKNKLVSWIDIVKGTLNTLDKRGKISTINFNEKIGAAIPLKNNNSFLVCGTKALYTYEDGSIKELYDLTNVLDPSQRCNDAKVDDFNRLWFSSIVDDGIHAPEGKLFCYTNKEVICMDPDLKLGNGICFNKKNNRMFLADSAAHCIFVYDYNLDTGYITNRRILCNIYDGVPDGMLIDKDENLWVAIWGGARIEVRSSKTGLLKKTIDTPITNPTALTFNEEEGMIIISSAKASDGTGGKLYSYKVDVKFPPFNYAKID
ncbi:MAG: SMP-30/gluconolactonase/LRE family protein [Acholeplasmatales bacterium]|nr:SMP-30/gluconolactonase/LRE family protein [Acholeplasmatales bacterium]